MLFCGWLFGFKPGQTITRRFGSHMLTCAFFFLNGKVQGKKKARNLSRLTPPIPLLPQSCDLVYVRFLTFQPCTVVSRERLSLLVYRKCQEDAGRSCMRECVS